MGFRLLVLHTAGSTLPAVAGRVQGSLALEAPTMQLIADFLNIWVIGVKFCLLLRGAVSFFSSEVKVQISIFLTATFDLTLLILFPKEGAMPLLDCTQILHLTLSQLPFIYSVASQQKSIHKKKTRTKMLVSKIG